MGIWPIYKTFFNLDLVLAGLLASIAGFCGEASQIVFGHFANKGYQKHLLALGLILGGGIFLLPLTNNYAIYFLILIGVYLGSGAYHPSASKMTAQLYPHKKGVMITLFSSGGQLGFALSQVVFIFAITLLNKQLFWLFIPLLAFLFVVKRRDFGTYPQLAGQIKFSQVFTPFKNNKAEILTLYFSQVASQVTFYGMIFVLPELLKNMGYPSWFYLGTGHLICVLGMALLMVPAGFLADKFGEKRLIYVYSILSFVAFYSFILFPPASIIGAGIFLFILGGFLGTLNPVFVSCGHKLFPNHLATVSAILMGFAWSLANLSFVFMGFLVKTLGITIAFSLLGTLILIPIFLGFLETYLVNLRKQKLLYP